MSDKKISQLSAASTPLAGTEILPVVQSGATKKVAVDDLTVKNLRANATTGILQVTGPAASATRVMTVPDANFTVARTDSTNTFANTQTVIGDVVAQGFGANYLKIQSLDSAAYRMAVKLSADDESLVITGPTDYKVLAVTGFSTPDTTRIYANNVEQLRVTAAATNVLNGNLIIGTAGKGIDFSADPSAAGMTSELLDDYEEGTWTPTVTVNSGTATGYTISNSVYTKVGRKVTVKTQITPTGGTFGNGTGYCSISGLPFQPSGSFVGGMLNTSNFFKDEFGLVGTNSVNTNVEIIAGITITVGNVGSLEVTYFV